MESMRVVFFGMSCAFSAPPLAVLLDAGVTVAAVVLPGSPGAAPLIRLPPLTASAGDARNNESSVENGRIESIESTIRRHRTPTLLTTDLRSAALLAELRGLAPDWLVVACFPWRIPASILATPRRGALNLHPSLLPRWRGPEPLFWTFHAGDATTGVTVHRLTDRLDAGPVVAQRRRPLPAGSRLPETEWESAWEGGRMLHTALLTSTHGADLLQDEELRTEAPIPTAADWVIEGDWSAERAYRFAAGLAPVGGPLAVRPTGSTIPMAVRDAVGWRSAVSGNGVEPMSSMEPLMRIDFVDGTVWFKTAK